MLAFLPSFLPPHASNHGYPPTHLSTHLGAIRPSFLPSFPPVDDRQDKHAHDMVLDHLPEGFQSLTQVGALFPTTQYRRTHPSIHLSISYKTGHAQRSITRPPLPRPALPFYASSLHPFLHLSLSCPVLSFSLPLRRRTGSGRWTGRTSISSSSCACGGTWAG